MMYKYVIVGGGAAGVSAAETIRQKDTEGTIAIISDEVHPLYSRVMLSKPNFFLGQIPFDKIWMKGKQWYEENRIAFLGGKIANSLDATAKKVTLEGGEEVGYEKLLLATGVRPNKLTVPGSNKKGIYYLRTLEEGQAIMEAIKTARRGVVVGGGFIGLEMADLLKMAGLETSIIIREAHFWEPMLDESSSSIIERALEKGGVHVVRARQVKEVLGGDAAEKILLDDGSEISVDMIVCGIGAHSDLAWLASSGLKTNRGILSDDTLHTDLTDVWTAGDVAEYVDDILDESLELGNWVNAKEQGRVAALNMMREKTVFNFVSFYTTQVFGTSIAFVGDAKPGKNRIMIPRGNAENGSYGQILILDKGDRKEVEGATLINRLSEMSTIAKLIGSNIDASDKLKALGDANIDLRSILK